MALVTCPDCKSQVSSSAAACIKCGCPFNTVQTIEQTGKGIKLQIFLSILGLFLSIFLAIAIRVEFLCLGFICMIWLLLAKIFQWWHHG